MKKLKLLMSSLVLVASSTAAFAQASGGGFGEVADTVRTGFLGPMGDFLGAAGLVLGIISILMAGVTIYKMRSGHHADPSATPARVGTFVLAGALLLALPATMGTGVQTLFGSSANTASIDGTLRSVE